jgi:hypothetical protein
VKVAVAVYSKQIKLCTQKVCTTQSCLVDSANRRACHTATGMPRQARTVVVVPPLHRVQHQSSSQKTIDSDAHEHEGGKVRRSSPTLRKETLLPVPPPKNLRQNKQKDERVLEPGAQRCHPRRFSESGRCSPGYLCKSGTPSWCEHGESRVNQAEMVKTPNHFPCL